MGERFPFSEVIYLEDEWIVCSNGHKCLQFTCDIDSNLLMITSSMLRANNGGPGGEIRVCLVCGEHLFNPYGLPRHVIKETKWWGVE